MKRFILEIAEARTLPDKIVCVSVLFSAIMIGWRLAG